jgi:hypothetical protein
MRFWAASAGATPPSGASASSFLYLPVAKYAVRRRPEARCRSRRGGPPAIRTCRSATWSAMPLGARRRAASRGAPSRSRASVAP